MSDAEALWKGRQGDTGRKGEKGDAGPPGESFWDRRRRQAAVVLLVIVFMLLGINLYWNASNTNRTTQTTNELIARDDHHWCTLLGTINSAYQSAPPTTRAGRNVSIAVAVLVHQFGCQ